MIIKLAITLFVCSFVLLQSANGDPGKDLCKIYKKSGLKCSQLISKFFPYETFLSFNDDLAQFTTGMNYLEIKDSNISVLQSRSFQRTPFLSHLVLSKIYLTEIETAAFEGLKRLKLVDLSYNLLQKIPVESFKFTKVKRLRLEGNPLLEIPTNGPILHANFLTSFSLKNCNIQQLPESVFTGIPVLEELDLSQNSLKSLPEDIFSSLHHLNHLDLSGNQFQSLDVKVFESIPAYPKHPSTVLLYKNPWICNCSLSKLGNWVTQDVKTGAWTETSKLCRLRKDVQCQKPSKISWNSPQFKSIISTC